MNKSNVSGVLLDLEGVLFVGNQVIEGAIDAVEYLQNNKIPLRFMTNTTTQSRVSIAEKMQKMGFNAQTDNILTAPYAARYYLEQKGNISCYLLVDDEVKNEFAGFRQSEQHPDVIVIGKPSSAFFYAGVDALKSPKERVVMIGDDIESDVVGAQRSGLMGALVKTGKYRKETCLSSTVTPDWILNSIADLKGLIQ